MDHPSPIFGGNAMSGTLQLITVSVIFAEVHQWAGVWYWISIAARLVVFINSSPHERYNAAETSHCVIRCALIAVIESFTQITESNWTVRYGIVPRQRLITRKSDYSALVSCGFNSTIDVAQKPCIHDNQTHCMPRWCLRESRKISCVDANLRNLRLLVLTETHKSMHS